MPFEKVGDINIYYEIGGSGPRLVHISGTGGDLRRKPSVFDSPLAQHFEILAFDQRGLGQTDKPNSPYTMADYAADVNGLMGALGWEDCPIMGVSFGGMVGPELALGYSNRVKSLIMCCTSSGGVGGPSFPLHELEGLSPDERRRKMVPITDTRRDQAWQDANPDELDEILKAGEAQSAIGEGEHNKEIGAHRQIMARKGHDVYDRLPSITIPVLLCAGKYDGIAPPDNQKPLESQLPNAMLDYFEGGHGFLAQDPKAYERIIKFLKA